MTAAFLLMLMGLVPPPAAQPEPLVSEALRTAAPVEGPIAGRIELRLRESLALDQSA